MKKPEMSTNVSYAQAMACYMPKKKDVTTVQNRFAVLQQKEEPVQKTSPTWREKLICLRNMMRQKTPMSVAMPVPEEP